jgi:broad specificity phosphatase PhoE
MITYFVHSTSFDNEKGIQSGWKDPGLSPKGKEQARRLRELVSEASFDLVIASDLLRAKQTAHILFPDHEVLYDERLREMNYGDLNGLDGNKFPDNKMWCIENRFKNGECCLDVQARVQDFINSSVPIKVRIAIISHRYPQLALEVICNQRTWPEAIAADWRFSGTWQPGWTYNENV